MFRNYFKTAYRNLLRNKSYSLINIAGLAVGMAVCLVIFLIIRFENSFDNFHKDTARIFRIMTESNGPDGKSTNLGVPYPTTDALRTDFPDATIVPINSGNNDQILVLNADGTILKKFKEINGFYSTDPEFFQLFNFKMINGSATSLKEPNTAILTRGLAEKYFGDWHLAVGRAIRYNNNRTYKIAGIMEDVPDNTDFQAKALLSYISLRSDNAEQDWRSVSSSHSMYMKVAPGITASALTAKLRTMLNKYRPSKNVFDNTLVAQNIAEIHFDEASGNLLGRSISHSLLNMLKLIAVFILVIACVNFINLSTAQAVNRSKEVGVRKVLGSNRGQLQVQFYCETVIIVLLSVALAILISYASLPAINSILSLKLALDFNSELVLFISALIAIVTLLAGFYPALVLSGFSPINALKSKISGNRTSGVSLRRALVVCQFVIAQGLIIGTLLMVKQMDFFRNSSMGFAKDAIITVPIPSDSTGRSQINYLNAALKENRDVKQVSFSFASPADNSNWYSDITFDHAEKGSDFGVNLKWADNNYLPLYDIKLAAGRNLVSSDTIREFVVNQTLVRKLGITDDNAVINKDLNLWGRYEGKIVGVVKDFHSSSFREQLVPILIASFKGRYDLASIKLESNNLNRGIESVRTLWDKTFPEYVFEYQFVDEKVASFYDEEQKISKLYKIFASLAIFLSCLGLYGLASFMAVQRIKEVGIRKVLGASVQSIVMLFSKEFILLIVIAFAIAAPLAYYFLKEWLQNYQYKTTISWWIFIAAAVSSIAIAVFTISFKAIRAAKSNPVKSLRSE